MVVTRLWLGCGILFTTRLQLLPCMLFLPFPFSSGNERRGSDDRERLDMNFPRYVSIPRNSCKSSLFAGASHSYTTAHVPFIQKFVCHRQVQQINMLRAHSYCVGSTQNQWTCVSCTHKHKWILWQWNNTNFVCLSPGLGPITIIIVIDCNRLHLVL